MADRYRAYDPASYYGRDLQDDYHMYGPRRTSLPPYYSPHAPVIPGARAPILHREYSTRPPSPPDDYISRAPFQPGEHDIIRHDSRAYGLDGPRMANPAFHGMSGLPAGARAPGPSPFEDFPLAGRVSGLPAGARAPVPSPFEDFPLAGRVSVLPAGARAPGPSPLEHPPLAGRGGLAPPVAQVEDPALIRRSSSLDRSAGIPDIEHRSQFLDRDDHLEHESNILFVDGLPSDCTRREVSHLFRPFVGFRDIRVVHKEPRRNGDKGYVLCFVEFEDEKYAFAAMKALQGYPFDDRKPDDPVLKIQFARFPFHLPGSEAAHKRRAASMR